MTRQYWMRALQIPTSKPRISIPNFQQYFPNVTLRNRRNNNVVDASSFAGRNPWATTV
jgi:hypothetical protein